MSDFSLTLVLQIETSKNHQWHGKGKHKIWENHSFWRNISREGAFFPFFGSGNRQSAGSEVYIIRLSKREIVGSLSSAYFCGGDCVEEQWIRLGKAAKVLHGREHCVPAADSIIRNFYKFLMDRIDAKAFGLKKTGSSDISSDYHL